MLSVSLCSTCTFGAALLVFTLSLVSLNEGFALSKNIENTYITSDHPVDVLPLHDGAANFFIKKNRAY